jgi:hypothetical protein
MTCPVYLIIHACRLWYRRTSLTVCNSLDGNSPDRRLCEVALPQHTLQILQLLLFEGLRSKLVRVAVQLKYKTYLNINVPSILAGLLEVC